MRALPFALALLVPTAVCAQAADEPSAPEESPATTTPATGEAAAPPADHAAEPAPQPAPEPARATPPPAAATGAGGPRTPQPSTPRRRPAEDEEEDEEDGGDPYDFLWIDLAGGVSYVDMRALNADNYYPEFVQLSGIGPMGTLALGFRLDFVAVGVRGTVAHYSDEFDVGTATAEVTLMLPISIVKPYLRVGFGLGWHGDGDFNAPANSQTTVFGFAFDGAVGLDIYFADWFSIGAAFSVDILNMNRQTIDEPIGNPGTIEFTETGDAVGAQIRGQGGVTFHL